MSWSSTGDLSHGGASEYADIGVHLIPLRTQDGRTQLPVPVGKPPASSAIVCLRSAVQSAVRSGQLDLLQTWCACPHRLHAPGIPRAFELKIAHMCACIALHVLESRGSPPLLRIAHSQHPPLLYVESVVQRYAATGLWLLVNAGTEGLRPNAPGKLCEPERHPAGLVNEAPVDETMHVGTSARDLSAATVLAHGRRRRRSSVADTKPRTRGTRNRQCPQCLSPMYSSHSCRTQPFVQSWRVHYDNEPTIKPVLTNRAWHEQSLDADPLHSMSR